MSNEAIGNDGRPIVKRRGWMQPTRCINPNLFVLSLCQGVTVGDAAKRMDCLRRPVHQPQWHCSCLDACGFLVNADTIEATKQQQVASFAALVVLARKTMPPHWEILWWSLNIRPDIGGDVHKKNMKLSLVTDSARTNIICQNRNVLITLCSIMELPLVR